MTKKELLIENKAMKYLLQDLATDACGVCESKKCRDCWAYGYTQQIRTHKPKPVEDDPYLYPENS